MLPGIHVFAGAAQTVFSFAEVDTAEASPGAGNSQTFSSMTAGAAATDRILIASIGWFDNGGFDNTFTWSVTIGGVSATEVVTSFADGGTDGGGVGIFLASVPTGTTADVAVTLTSYAGSVDQWVCGLYRATKLNTTPTDTSTGTTNITMDTTGADFVIVPYSVQGGSVGDLTGGGNPTTSIINSTSPRCGCGYDDAPLGGATDTYDESLNGADVFVGAAFAES